MVAAWNDVLIFKPVIEEIPDDKKLLSVFFYMREKTIAAALLFSFSRSRSWRPKCTSE